VPATVILTGLACGTLLAAAGLVLWGSPRQLPGLSRTVRVISWLAGGLLLIGAVLAWQEDYSLSAPALRLTLMAALAAPPGIHRHTRSPWGSLMLTLPALALAGASLFWTPEWTPAPTGMEVSNLLGAPGKLTAIRLLAVIICAGLGARALGEALSTIAVPALHIERPAATTYALLTLLVSGTTLSNLWQQGAVWGGIASEGGLAGAWLAWSAAWLGPRHPRRLRAALTAVAASLLIVLAAGY